MHDAGDVEFQQRTVTWIKRDMDETVSLDRLCIGRFLIFGVVSFFLVSSGSGLVRTNGSGCIEVGLTGCIKSPEASNAP